MNYNTLEVRRKACNKCGNVLAETAEYFNRSSKQKSGFVGICKQCKLEHRLLNPRKEYYKKWKAENEEKLKEYYRNYHKENKDKRNRQVMERYYKKHDEICEYHRKRAADPEFKIRRREYRKSRKERDRYLNNKWRSENKERVSTIKQRRYNKKKNLPADLTHEQWLEIVADFDNKCAYCGKEKELTRDHFIPITKNGEFTKNNIIPACRSCNSSKHNTDFFEWYPNYEYYSKVREQKILKYLNYNKNKEQQLALL